MRVFPYWYRTLRIFLVNPAMLKFCVTFVLFMFQDSTIGCTYDYIIWEYCCQVGYRQKRAFAYII